MKCIVAPIRFLFFLNPFWECHRVLIHNKTVYNKTFECLISLKYTS